MKDEAIERITAMCCLTILISLAVSQGIDGVLLATGIAGISGLGGYIIKAKREG